MKLLEKLVLTPGVSGREHRIREFIRQEVKGLFDTIQTDAMGSLICVRLPRHKGKGKSRAAAPRKVMLAAHMDQIGFMVSFIDDRGFIRLNAVGGFDTRNLFARLVRVTPDLADPSKDLMGVLNPAGRPIHVATEEEKKRTPEVKDFIVDLGLEADEVRKRVKVGDPVTLVAPFTEVGATAVSQCMDNRIACWIAIEAVRKLKSHACEVHCVFTSQEEVGLRGALTAAYAVRPDIGIAIDTTLCIDTPGVPAEERVTAQGGGAALTVMDGSYIADLEVVEAFEKLAQKHDIKHQRSIQSRGGTDAGALQRAASGAPTMTLSCPTRYIHTVTEMVLKTDLYACRDLLALYLESVA